MSKKQRNTEEERQKKKGDRTDQGVNNLPRQGKSATKTNEENASLTFQTKIISIILSNRRRA